MIKNIITVTGIRPDFIRMSEIFKKLDQNFNHILIHSGQHYDRLLSDVFFDELKIRVPDYNLSVGGNGKEHFHQTSELSVKLIELIREKDLKPDIILFLGDSNSVTCSVDLKKEGYIIGHIEAGMRSGDRRMLEEINRIVCDVCSDYHFVYHKNYKEKLEKENIRENVYVVGNTIVEVANKYKLNSKKKNSLILLDIHRPENFLYKERLSNIIQYANMMGNYYKLPIKMLNFKRTTNKLIEFNINMYDIEIVDLMSYKNYLETIHNSLFIISDSGTAQEEPALLNTPVIVPRDYTERPESIEHGCSYMIDVNIVDTTQFNNSVDFINNTYIDSSWLGDGKTSDKIVEILKGMI